MATNYPKQGQAQGLSPQQNNAMREQQIINARIVALDKALEFTKLEGNQGLEKLLANAARIVGYLIDDVQALKPQSGIIQQVSMPPAGMFKTGE